MAVSQTSLLAYKSIQDKLGDKQEMVFEAIKDLGRASNEELSKYLNWPINRVTGRCTELRNYGLIEVAGITRNDSGASAKVWAPTKWKNNSLQDMAADCEN